MYREELVISMSRWYHPGTDTYYTVFGVGYLNDCACQRDSGSQVIYWSDTSQKWLITPRREFLLGAFVPLGPSGGPLPIETSLRKE